MSVKDAYAPAAPGTALKVLADALERRNLPPGQQVVAQIDSRSPPEGLALLGAYTAIEDRQLRQAILDVVVTVSTGAHRERD